MIQKYSQGSHSDWKTWKIERHFPVREKLGNFEKKNWKGQGKSHKILENSGKFRQMLFVIF